MKLVLKIGGVALENQETLQACVKAIKSLAEDGHQLVVVHGGGSALTRTLKKLGKTSEFVNGLLNVPAPFARQLRLLPNFRR